MRCPEYPSGEYMRPHRPSYKDHFEHACTPSNLDGLSESSRSHARVMRDCSKGILGAQG